MYPCIFQPLCKEAAINLILKNAIDSLITCIITIKRNKLSWLITNIQFWLNPPRTIVLPAMLSCSVEVPNFEFWKQSEIRA